MEVFDTEFVGERSLAELVVDRVDDDANYPRPTAVQSLQDFCRQRLSRGTKQAVLVEEGRSLSVPPDRCVSLELPAFVKLIPTIEFAGDQAGPAHFGDSGQDGNTRHASTLVASRSPRVGHADLAESCLCELRGQLDERGQATAIEHDKQDGVLAELRQDARHYGLHRHQAIGGKHIRTRWRCGPPSQEFGESTVLGSTASHYSFNQVRVRSSNLRVVVAPPQDASGSVDPCTRGGIGRGSLFKGCWRV